MVIQTVRNELRSSDLLGQLAGGDIAAVLVRTSPDGVATAASRVRQRIEKVLDWAKGRGYRSGDNPAAWKGNLQAHLADPTKIAKPKHHRAASSAARTASLRPRAAARNRSAWRKACLHPASVLVNAPALLSA